MKREFASLKKFNEELCGDKVEVYHDDRRFLMALSDGLGSGVKANILATLTSKIIITMVKEGMGLSDVIDTIGKTLPICQVRNISYATFTIVEIDKINSIATLIEFDNPGALIFRDNRLIEIEGVKEEFKNHKVKKSIFKLQYGDILVLFSDGVIHAGIGAKLKLGWPRKEVARYIHKIIRRREGISMEELADWLAEACNNFYDNKPGDDTTIAAIRVRPSQSVTILVGPPKDRSKDKEVTELLMKEEGKKIVCGGTTSKLVARELGKNIKVELDEKSKNMSKVGQIPPGGTIEGIDLVTEGVLTLQRVYSVLSGEEKLPKGNYGINKTLYTFVETLRESDVITFLVGRAINPAYQNPDLPLATGVKEHLINKIASILQRQGKRVNIKYF